MKHTPPKFQSRWDSLMEEKELDMYELVVVCQRCRLVLVNKKWVKPTKSQQSQIDNNKFITFAKCDKCKLEDDVVIKLHKRGWELAIKRKGSTVYRKGTRCIVVDNATLKIVHSYRVKKIKAI